MILFVSAEARITCEFPSNVTYKEDSLCTPIQCAMPDNISGTVLTQNKTVYTYMESVRYTCIEGYRHSAGDLTRRCGQDMHWTGSIIHVS